MPGMYAVTSIPLVKRTLATFLKAELGFFGVTVFTDVHTPLFWGELTSVATLLREFIPLLRAGAVDFLKKPIDEELLLATLEEHLTEHFYKTRGLPSPKELHEVVDGFTDRERNVFELMLQNLTPTAIGERLGLSNRTVYEYRSSIYRKLRTRDLSQLPLENFPAGFSGN